MSKSAWDEVKHTWPESNVNLVITASQFNWEVRYPGADGKSYTADDVVLNNEMYVPVIKPKGNENALSELPETSND
jgi:hypothetical protein